MNIFSRIILLITVTVIAVSTNAQNGTWSGNLELQGTKLPLVFHFDNNQCTLDSPAQGVRGLKAERIFVPGVGIKVSIPTIMASFEGKMESDTIKGIFMQNGAQFPLILTQGEKKMLRPQTPKAPFPYTTEEITFTNCDYTFHGTLTTPQNCSRETPVVVFITGSGLQNRDEEIYGHKPFAVIADALARNGIASLRYDDYGVGDATARPNNHTTYDAKNDAEAAIALLKKRFKKVGIIGHSEGGTIALLIASENNADFIVSLAGMVISGRETLLDQNCHQLKNAGAPDNFTSSFRSALEGILDQLAEGKNTDDLDLTSVPTPLKSQFKEMTKSMSSHYYRTLIQVDARKNLGNIKCPVLAINGTKDVQVDCNKNLQALEKGLTECQKTLSPKEGLNHLLQHCTTGNITEYGEIEETISQDVLDDIVKWIESL